VNEGKSSFAAQTVQAHAALRRLRPKKKRVAETQREAQFVSNDPKEKLIENNVKRESARARKGVEDVEAMIWQKQENTEAAENTGLTTTEPENKSHEMMVAIANSQSDSALTDDGEEDNADTEQGQLSETDEPSWVMGTMAKMVQQCMERLQQMQIKNDELIQLRWEDTADNICETDKQYAKSELQEPAVVHPQTDDDTASPALITLAEHAKSLHIVPGILQMPQGPNQPRRRDIRLASGKPQWNMSITSLAPSTEHDSSTFPIGKPIEPISIFPFVEPPQLITT
jgi:hypothetical protein